MYIFRENSVKQCLEARFWYCDGNQIAIVASITKGIDWAAYIGAENISGKEEETLDYCLKYGCKLSEQDARHFFPDIKLPYRE